MSRAMWLRAQCFEFVVLTAIDIETAVRAAPRLLVYVVRDRVRVFRERAIALDRYFSASSMRPFRYNISPSALAERAERQVDASMRRQRFIDAVSIRLSIRQPVASRAESRRANARQERDVLMVGRQRSDEDRERLHALLLRGLVTCCCRIRIAPARSAKVGRVVSAVMSCPLRPPSVQRVRGIVLDLDPCERSHSASESSVSATWPLLVPNSRRCAVSVCSKIGCRVVDAGRYSSTSPRRNSAVTGPDAGPVGFAIDAYCLADVRSAPSRSSCQHGHWTDP